MFLRCEPRSANSATISRTLKRSDATPRRALTQQSACRCGSVRRSSPERVGFLAARWRRRSIFQAMVDSIARATSNPLIFSSWWRSNWHPVLIALKNSSMSQRLRWNSILRHLNICLNGFGRHQAPDDGNGSGGSFNLAYLDEIQDDEVGQVLGVLVGSMELNLLGPNFEHSFSLLSFWENALLFSRRVLARAYPDGPFE